MYMNTSLSTVKAISNSSALSKSGLKVVKILLRSRNSLTSPNPFGVSLLHQPSVSVIQLPSLKNYHAVVSSFTPSKAMSCLTHSWVQVQPHWLPNILDVLTLAMISARNTLT